MTLHRSRFPSDFVWGSATAAHQVEGSFTADGRGPSIWDTFAHVPGAISDGTTAETADDHYRRYLQDADAMVQLGVNAYRFSIAWSRIQPTGAGAANAAGVDFYSRLTDALLERGIAPWVTLYHWDLPQALEDQGGWLARDTAERFADYSAIVVDALGDRVNDWITLNEPQAATFAGYRAGVHAPGKQLGLKAAAAGHHLLLGHGRALQIIREQLPDARAGITLDIWPIHPLTDSEADRQAAVTADARQNRFFLDAVLGGGYPAEVLREVGEPEWFAANPAEDAALIAAPVDFLGINFYSRHTVRAAGVQTEAREVEFVETEVPRTQMGWEIHPASLREALRIVNTLRPELPLYITENGSAWPDEVAPDGGVHDPDRQAYLESHLTACAEAIEAGIPLKGYFAWSLMDNWEWQFGLSRRFGLYHVDFQTQVRTLKDSGRWFSQFLGE